MATNETATTSIYINSEQARAEVKRLEEVIKSLNSEFKVMAKTDPGYKEKQQQLKDLRAEHAELKKQITNRIDVVINGQLADASMKELRMAANQLRKEIETLSPATAEFATKAEQLRNVNTRMTELNQTVKPTAGLFKTIGNEIKAFGLLAVSYLGIQELSSQITNVISKNAKLSDSLADIRMTTGLTAEEVKKLNSELGKIDTRTSAADLREIANVAGQFGVAKNEILGFTESINKAAVVLSGEFKGGTEEIATELAKLRNVMGNIKTEHIDQDLLHIGNALVKLAQEGVATAPVVADFANRIAGVGTILGLTGGQVLGLSATMQELGISTERGGTAIGKILQKMSNNSVDFAKTAGVPLKEYQKLVNTDIYEAFLKFVDGSKKSGNSAIAFANVLKDAEISGAGASEVIAKLSVNQKMLAERTELATQALKQTTAITEQYKLKNETLGAELDKLGKKFYGLFTSDSATQFLTKQVSNISLFIDWLKKLPQFLSDNALSFRLIAEAAILYNFALIKATTSSIVNTTAELANKAAKQLNTTWTAIADTATKAYSLSTDVLSGRISFATGVQRVWNAVIMQNPLGWAVAGILALIEAVDIYRKNTSEAIQLEKDKYKISTDLIKINKDLEKSTEEYNKQLENFNRLAPEQREALKDQIALKLKDAEASLLQLQAEREKVVQQSSTVGTWQSVGNFLKNIMDTQQMSIDNNTTAIQNGIDAGAKYNTQIDAIAKNVKLLGAQLSTVTDVQKLFTNAMGINAQTTEQYQEKLTLLHKALDLSVLKSTEYKNIAAEIAKVQDELNKKTTTVNVDSKEAIKKLEELKKKLIEIEFDLSKQGKSKYEIDISEVEKKYADLETAAKGNAELLKRIAADKAVALLNIEKDYQKSLEEFKNSVSPKSTSKDQKEIDDLTKKYDAEIAIIKGNAALEIQLETDKKNAIDALQKTQSDKHLENLKELGEKVSALIGDELANKIAAETIKWNEIIEKSKIANATIVKDAAKTGRQLTEEERKQTVDIIKLEKGKADAIYVITKKANEDAQTKNDAAITKFNQAQEKKWKSAEAAVGGYAQGITAIMQLVGTNTKTQADFEKIATVAMIAIRTAEAIATMTAKSTAGDPYSYAARVAIGIGTILVNMAEASAVLSKSSTPNAPNLENPKTTKKAENGAIILDGPSHDNHGIKLHDASGKPIIEAEGGEPVLILSKELYKNNKTIIDEIIHHVQSNNTGPIADGSGDGRILSNINGALPSTDGRILSNINGALPSTDGRILSNVVADLPPSTDGRILSNISADLPPSTDGRILSNKNTPDFLPKLKNGAYLNGFEKTLSQVVPSFRNSPLTTIDTRKISESVQQIHVSVHVKQEKIAIDVSKNNDTTDNNKSNDIEMQQSLKMLAHSLAKLNANLENPTPAKASISYQQDKIDRDRINQIISEVTIGKN